MKKGNGFGDETYWNRQATSRQRRHLSKYTTLTLKVKKEAPKSLSPTTATRTATRSLSPTPSNQSSVSTVVSPSRSAAQMPIRSKEEENDAKDEKAIVKLMKSTLPKFSNEADWEMAIFELGLVLDRVWPHKEEMDIMDYMTLPHYHQSPTADMEDRADRFIYFALTMSAQKDSYAKMQIMAACHKDAVPCVLKNEGRKLYQMFQALFTMTNLHQASLPTIRAEFYSLSQKENENILQYSSRVDIIVATLAKLGEKLSTGAWIYGLGNGLRSEFKECKDGILYTKTGYDTVISVKTKLLSEEAVLTSKKKKAEAASAPSTSRQDKDDEIALVSIKPKETNPKQVLPSTDTDPKDKTFFTKGKGGKGNHKGKGKNRNRWQEPQWSTNWNQPEAVVDPNGQWPISTKGKGRGKGKSYNGSSKGFDPQSLWCDFHQRHGHSTDWCYENPNRTGGAPLANDRLWCETCNRTGHTATSCYATTIRITPKGKGNSPPSGGKGTQGDRSWKSPNFPAGHNSEQATPALHDETSSSTKVWWDDHELGSTLVDNVNAPNRLSVDPIQSQDGNSLDGHNHYDDDDEDSISEYIDLILYAIVQNIERQREYRLSPKPQLLRDIHQHSSYITNAENCTNIHIQRIIRQFKTSVGYDPMTSESNEDVITIPTDNEFLTTLELKDTDLQENNTEITA